MKHDDILNVMERCGKLTPEQLKPIRLSPCEYIQKPHLFVNHHIERINASHKSAKPYYDRLIKFLNLVNA